ncbi:hypothetical protein HPB48_005554 [Haemaphysalis longicornis]|uniref:Uncharacterized protein n=1 Tax=Haemaphysalis longicornis TaxID=44386 RepID=A0A9J6H5N4_HAELO|nr:hypothetical protein HPB48_005554 [Haemaphysalis longicornis]
MRERGTYEAYVQLLYLSLVDPHGQEIPWIKETIFAEAMVPYLAEAAELYEETECTTTADIVSNWQNATELRLTLSRFANISSGRPVVLQIDHPTLFKRFLNPKGSRVEARRNTSILVSWYALQTAVMYAYAPGIEMMHGNISSAVEGHAARCRNLTLWSMGTARQFLAIPRAAFESTQLESRSLINRVTASFLKAFIGDDWRVRGQTSERLLSLNRRSLALLDTAAERNAKWTTSYTRQRPFINLWRWVTKHRAPRGFREEPCCGDRSPQASVNVLTMNIGAECCGLYTNLIRPSVVGEEYVAGKSTLPPFQLQPILWNAPFFGPELPVAMKYGGLGSVAGALVAANYFEGAEASIYNDSRAHLEPCLKGTQGDTKEERGAVEAVAMTAMALVLRNASLEPLWDAYRSTWEDEKRGSMPEREQRLRDDRLFYLSWCFVTCGELGARELCNEPVRGNGNFANTFQCASGRPMTTPRKCGS